MLAPLETFDIYYASVVPNIATTLTVVVLCIFSFSFCLSYSLSLVPKESHVMAELMLTLFIESCKLQLLRSNLCYTPKIFTLFIFIVSINITGMVPFSFTVTSQLILNLYLSLALCVWWKVLSCERYSFFVLSMLLPRGVPLGIMPGLVLIEVLSIASRIISLSVRLFANLLAGHTLLKILTTLVWGLLFTGSFLPISFLLPAAFVLILFLLEICIACIQAYVFVLLSCIYIKGIY
jgi:ATP synthase subunit 6